jgi:deoxynucleoside triphosphate triphosphohydrolase SAMHD1
LIAGRRTTERGWIFDIVSNSRNSIDVDKFDYLARDAYHIGKKTPFEFPRYDLFLLIKCYKCLMCLFSRSLKLMRVIGEEICFHKKERYHLYQLFESRYSMFKQVYSHRVGKAIELMIADAFMEADPVMRISSQLDQPEDFMGLTDSLLMRIQFSKEKELEAARQIVYSILKCDVRTRDIALELD